jgi:hypothetical protein
MPPRDSGELKLRRELRMQSRTAEFLIRLLDLAKECDVAIKVDEHRDVIMLPTYKRDGSLDEWSVVGVNPYRRYDFELLTQETQ